MKRFRFLALLMSAMLIAGAAVSCKDDKDKAKSSEIVASDGSKLSGIVSPDSESDEAELGDYRITESGTKVYYEEDKTPVELVLAVEKYFKAIAEKDFDAYCEIVQPEYAEVYGDYLEAKNDSIQNSFKLQSDNCEVQVGGKYKLTRIRIEASEEDLSEGYFEVLEGLMGEGTAQKMKDAADELITIVFFVMVEAEGEEHFLAQESKMIIAKQDGKYFIMA